MTVQWKPREDSTPALSVIQCNEGRWQVIFRTFPVRMDGPSFYMHNLQDLNRRQELSKGDFISFLEFSIFLDR
jgi:hypothetical protein